MKAWPEASSPQTSTGNCTETRGLRRRSMFLPGVDFIVPGNRARENLHELSGHGYWSLETRWFETKDLPASRSQTWSKRPGREDRRSFRRPQKPQGRL